MKQKKYKYQKLVTVRTHFSFLLDQCIRLCVDLEGLEQDSGAHFSDAPFRHLVISNLWQLSNFLGNAH